MAGHRTQQVKAIPESAKFERRADAYHAVNASGPQVSNKGFKIAFLEPGMRHGLVSVLQHVRKIWQLFDENFNVKLCDFGEAKIIENKLEVRKNIFS